MMLFEVARLVEIMSPFASSTKLRDAPTDLEMPELASPKVNVPSWAPDPVEFASEKVDAPLPSTMRLIDSLVPLAACSPTKLSVPPFNVTSMLLRRLLLLLLAMLLSCSVAPCATVTDVAEAKLPEVVPSESVPALTVTPPDIVEVLFTIRLPVPSLLNPPAPSRTPDENVAVPPETTFIDGPEPASVRLFVAEPARVYPVTPKDNELAVIPVVLTVTVPAVPRKKAELVFRLPHVTGVPVPVASFQLVVEVFQFPVAPPRPDVAPLVSQ